jgi:hypothetical protein
MAAPGIFGPKLLSLFSHSTAVASFGSTRAMFLATCTDFFSGSPDLHLLLSPQVYLFFSLVWHWHLCWIQRLFSFCGSFCGIFSGLGVHALPIFFPFSKFYLPLFDLLFFLKPCEIFLLFVEVTPKLSSVANFTQPVFGCGDPLL